MVRGARVLYARYGVALALAGIVVTAGQLAIWFAEGAWPPHDTANIWLAGRRLLEGERVYTGAVGQFLVFVYSPPIAVLAAPLSLLPVEVLSAIGITAQILALRWIAGSWKVTALCGWLPWVPRELVTGNVDLLIAAAILAAVLGHRGSGVATSVFAFMKFSPAIATSRWREFAVTSVLLVAITIPWLELWPAWIETMRASLATPTDTVPIVLRLPIVAVLLVLRRPWSIAAAAALATPAFYPGHSPVLLFPAAKLLLQRVPAHWWTGEREPARVGEAAEVSPAPLPR